MRSLLLILLSFMILLSVSSTANAVAQPFTQTPTITPLPTETLGVPTSTLIPTSTPVVSTSTSVPTATPVVSTSTSAPTSTQTVSTSTPAPPYELPSIPYNAVCDSGLCSGEPYEHMFNHGPDVLVPVWGRSEKCDWVVNEKTRWWDHQTDCSLFHYVVAHFEFSALYFEKSNKCSSGYWAESAKLVDGVYVLFPSRKNPIYVIGSYAGCVEFDEAMRVRNNGKIVEHHHSCRGYPVMLATKVAEK